MTQFRLAPLAAAATLTLLAAIAWPASAAGAGIGAGGPQAAPPSNYLPQTRAQRRQAKEAAEQKKAARTAKAAPLYPEATRDEPAGIPSRGGVKRLQEMQAAYEKQDDKTVVALAGEITSDQATNEYDKSFAYLLAGSASANMDDQAAAADAFGKAIQANGLPNNDHYTAMFNLAVTQYGLERYQDALQTLDRFLAETKSDKPEALELRGGLLMSLERYADAADLYGKLLAEKPENKTLRSNAVSAYLQADQPAKATAVLADALANGRLATPEEYRALYVNYINADHDKDAIRVIDDGIAKGILAASPELGKDYMVLGQRAYYANDNATAIEMYKRAAPMTADGEAWMNLARVYVDAGRTADARAAAEQALAKGVKDTAAAKRLAGKK